MRHLTPAAAPWFPPILLLLLLSACAGGHGGGGALRWDGRRGYDGNGDYGYDPDAPRAAAAYRARAAARSYPTPGPPDDPWGPHIREAAARHAVPERWIREVMRQESGGRADATSRAGAMGLMQVMPGTYAMLRRRHALGDDPYEPRDNVMAGAAYIRAMHDRFGAPAFLAAYNAGPERVEAWLAGATVLPDETENYLARVAPRLGAEVPDHPYRSRGVAVAAADGRWRGGADPPRRDGWAAALDPSDRALDPSDRAFDGGGLVTPLAPTGDRTGLGTASGGPYRDGPAEDAAPSWPRAAAASAAAEPQEGGRGAAGRADLPGHRIGGPPAPALVPVSAPVPMARPAAGAWGVQVGAFPDPAVSRAAAAAARSRAPGPLAGARPEVTPVARNGVLYRARLVGLSADTASAACAALSRGGTPCFTVPPGS